jgi:hypothetical protein
MAIAHTGSLQATQNYAGTAFLKNTKQQESFSFPHKLNVINGREGLAANNNFNVQLNLAIMMYLIV